MRRKLVLGVSDKRPRKVVGTTAFPQPERTSVDLMDKLRVRIDFHIYQHIDGRVLVLEVASRPIGLPVQADGGAWWYRGDSLVLLPEDVRLAIYAESGHDFSGDICADATMQDLDMDAIEDFRDRWAKKSRNNRIENLPVEQLLMDCEAITEKGITYAALILFGTRAALGRHLSQTEVIFEYRSKETPGPAQQREEFRIGFFSYYDKIWELVNLRNDMQNYQEGLFVFDVPTFNERVVRESLLNAVSHRNYQLGSSVFVRQYRDRLVIESPGGFPPGITVENILNRQSPRNRLIASILALCGLVERSGQGMNLMYEMAVKEAKPLPDFTGSDAYYIMLTLSGQVYDPKMLALIMQTSDELLESMTSDDYLLLSVFFHRNRYAEIHRSRFEHLAELGLVNLTGRGIELVNGGRVLLTDDNGVHVVDDAVHVADKVANVADAVDVVDVVDDVVDNVVEVLLLLEEKPSKTAKQIAETLSISERQVQRIMKKLRESNKIRRVGSDRIGHWEIIE